MTPAANISSNLIIDHQNLSWPTMTVKSQWRSVIFSGLQCNTNLTCSGLSVRRCVCLRKRKILQPRGQSCWLSAERCCCLGRSIVSSPQFNSQRGSPPHVTDPLTLSPGLLVTPSDPSCGLSRAPEKDLGGFSGKVTCSRLLKRLFP